MSDQETAKKKEQKPRHRSPNYPIFGLRAAVSKVQALYKADGLAPAQKLAAIKHMGYDKFHSDAARAISALKSFGLVEESAERIKLTQRGIDVVVRQKGDLRYDSAIREAAKGPDIYEELIDDYRESGFPSDQTLKAELIAVKKFNPIAVDSFIRDLKDTLAFANLSPEEMVDSKEIGAAHDEPAVIKVGDLVQWESNGQTQFRDPQRVREITPDGKWAFVEASATGLPLGELTKMDAITPDVQHAPTPPTPPAGRTAQGASHTTGMRSYSWALSGDFNARMDLFGEAETEEDIDALKDYVDITIKALKRSLKSRQATEG